MAKLNKIKRINHIRECIKIISYCYNDLIKDVKYMAFKSSNYKTVFLRETSNSFGICGSVEDYLEARNDEILSSVGIRNINDIDEGKFVKPLIRLMYKRRPEFSKELLFVNNKLSGYSWEQHSRNRTDFLLRYRKKLNKELKTLQNT